jgi:hypothetical protein
MEPPHETAQAKSTSARSRYLDGPIGQGIPTPRRRRKGVAADAGACTPAVRSRTSRQKQGSPAAAWPSGTPAGGHTDQPPTPLMNVPQQLAFDDSG